MQSVTSPWEESKAGAGKYTLVFFHNRLEFALTAIWRIRFWGLSVILKENPRELHGLTYHTLAVLWTTPGFSFISSYCRRTESALSSACYQAGCPTRCTGLCLVSSSQNSKATLLCSGVIYNFARCSEKFPCLIWKRSASLPRRAEVLFGAVLRKWL